ncbi:ATP-dependent Lon protease [Clostridium algifaecis]|uniref:Lon protease n=1 Tax=Clostridium algifaecis TaxID=1472040 RepID=A0ABS4KRY1_9CLOT|nr:endopeptidase La [Clostridium algifaecis]MBP2032778.1 ATP-dependent Lon protease [Clostridium algifaecis]
MDKNLEVIPLIPLRGVTIFPYMVLHFDVGREKSKLALEEAMINGQKVFLSSQKEYVVEEPNKEDIFETGTICTIKQMLKLPENTIRVLVEGEKRGILKEYLEEKPFFKVKIEVIEDSKDVDDNCKALIRLVVKKFHEYMNLSGDNGSESIIELDDMDNPGRLADTISAYLEVDQNKKQQILDACKIEDRLEKILSILANEIEILKIENKIGIEVKNNIDKNQKDYYLREQLKIIQNELGEDDRNKKEIKKYKEKILKRKLPKQVKEKAIYELDRLKNCGDYSTESGIIKTYLDWILDLPWNVKTKDNLNIKNVRNVLEKEHYGLKDVKDRIIEYLAVKNVSKSLKGPILCLVGPPGVGKTSIAKSIAKALNRNFVRMSLGGIRDEAEIRGHRRTYVGSIPGRIIYGIKEAKSNNPLFLLDEIDKMGLDFKGNPADALLEVLDSEQNNTFRDHYIELDFDLSNVLFITTANTLDTIPMPLIDRMEIIQVSGYTSEEKFHICKNYLIPRQLKENGIKDDKIKFSDAAIYTVIDNYTRESGVRNLERKIASIIRKSITEIIEKNKQKIFVNVTKAKSYLGSDMFTYDKADMEDRVGVVMGMAWTAYGGDTLPIEAAIMPGKGRLELTGQLGDVMKESAKAGYSYVRANCKKYSGIEKDFYKNYDLHIHVPEGAIPKDGPSAGVTMITAMVSALSKKKVKHNVAMTGEITLTGRVLPIGGLKEKSLAAYRAGIDTIIIPKDNEKDLKKIPKDVKSKVNYILADNIDTVLKNALMN